jgi:NH3-dependent NAD+ synthetase
MVNAMVEAGYDRKEIQDRMKGDPTIMGSIRSTLRAPWGRAANRLSGGGIRHGTGNEDEDRVLRFYQKGGDGEVDSNPISMLSKGEVFQLGIALGVPRSILSARPSPDLWGVGEEHNDEEDSVK